MEYKLYYTTRVVPADQDSSFIDPHNETHNIPNSRNWEEIAHWAADENLLISRFWSRFQQLNEQFSLDLVYCERLMPWERDQMAEIIPGTTLQAYRQTKLIFATFSPHWQRKLKSKEYDKSYISYNLYII